MKKYLPSLFLLLIAASAVADEQTRKIQSALNEAGFYYGAADGKMGEETRAALRRFQIRNGLDVSGNPSAETLASLKIEQSREPNSSKPNQAASDEEQIASTAKNPDAFLAPKVAVQRSSQPPITQRPPSPTAPVNGVSPARKFFSETELSSRNSLEQDAALLDAQRRLARLGYYRGAPDGLPGAAMEEALLRFQHSIHLRLTGRLDDDTRQALFVAPPSVPTKRFRSSNNRPSGQILRGIWVK